MTFKLPSLICFAVLLLGSACFRGGTAALDTGDDKGQMKQSPATTTTPREVKELGQKDLAQLAIDSGSKERKGPYSNYEYGYSITIPEGVIGVSNPSPYPQHGFSIPLSNQPEAQIWVDGSFNAAMYTSLPEATENYLKYLRDESEEVEVLIRESVKLHKLNAMRVVAKYKNKAISTTMIQDLVIAIRQNANADEPEVIYTLRLRTPESRYATDKDILDMLISTWRTTSLGR